MNISFNCTVLLKNKNVDKPSTQIRHNCIQSVIISGITKVCLDDSFNSQFGSRQFYFKMMSI